MYAYVRACARVCMCVCVCMCVYVYGLLFMFMSLQPVLCNQLGALPISRPKNAWALNLKC